MPTNTFELRVRGDDNCRCRLEARIPDATRLRAEVKVRASQDWTPKLEQLEQTVRAAAARSLRDINDVDGMNVEATDLSQAKGSSTKILKEIGKELFDEFFPRNIRSAYAEQLKKAKEMNEPLSLRLCFETPHLSYLPWETLYDGEEFLALSRYSPVVRAARFEEEDEIDPVELPICVLGMVSRPRKFRELDLKPLNLEAEQANIKLALEPLEPDKAILRWSGGTTAELENLLREPPEEVGAWNIFHFCGHGGFDLDENMGFLFVEPNPALAGWEDADDEQGRALFADDLNQLLQYAPGMRLVVLNSCRGALGTSGARSAAELLVRGGFPAVIAMQLPISDWAATCFSKTLYNEIAKGTPLHESVQWARRAIKSNNNSAEWITPVLYMRGTSGKLLRV